MKKVAIAALVLAVSTSANAGYRTVTAHSRANCLNNESITWYAKGSYDWRVISYHYFDKNPQSPNAQHHVIDTGRAHTWRQAAVHWGEAPFGSNFYVIGLHYWYPNGQERLDVKTDAVDCSGYDGYWDF